MNVEEKLREGIEHHKAGRWIEANQLYKQVLAIYPDEPDALRLLGQLTFQTGNSARAEELIRRAIELRPRAVDFHVDLSRIASSQGRFAEAVASLRRAIELNPFASTQVQLEFARALISNKNIAEAMERTQQLVAKDATADALGLHGELLLITGRVQQAGDQLKAAADLAPDRADLHGAYALALQQRGDFELAETEYRRALQLDGKSAELRNNLGRLLVLRRELTRAVIELKEAIQLRPNFPQAHHNLALAHTGLGQTDEALAAYRKALEQEPRFAEAWEGLGRVLMDLRQWKAAITAFGNVVALRPTVQAYIFLGIAHAGLDDLDGAIEATTKAVELAPDSAEAHDALGGELQWTGQMPAAMEQFRLALQIDPTHQSAHSKLVYSMLMQDGFSPAEILAEHVEWSRRQTGTIIPLRRPRNMPDPNRRLRIGYVSPNFRSQAVSTFVLPILQHHDQTNIEIYCYSDVEVPDATTARYQSVAHQWRDTARLSDEELARQIRADRIDIVVELTGHIGKGRLRAMAYRPAPVQVGYIGYQGTTGVSAVDYIITDDWADPPGKSETNYVEKPYRLPGSFFVYAPTGDAPLVGPLPAKRAGYITFGCLNAVSKVTPRAVALWARVLLAVPGSRMHVLSTRCAATDYRLLSEFSAAGIFVDRLVLLQRSSPAAYFRRYNAIDIALDPVPFNGHTTTCDAAWMGVPTVTLSGKIYAHRYGGSALRNLNLPDLVTGSENAYVVAAVGLASDLDRLTQLRSSLRFTMQQSLITNGPAFTRNLEAAYRDMWQRWCATSQ